MNLDELEGAAPPAPAQAKSPRGEVVTDPQQLKAWRDAGALPPRGLRTVVAFPLALDASWSAVRAAIAAKTQSLGGDLAEDHGALYARRRPIAKDFERIGPAWKRREGLVGTVKRADELWVKRTLTLSRGELAYFEKPTDWMVSTSARGRLSVTKDTSIVATENEDGAYFRGPAGAPTPHTLSVNDEWTFAFEDSRSLIAWRDALETAKTTPPAPSPPIFELRAAAATSSGSETRQRHLVVACDGDCREPIRAAVRALRDEDAACAELWSSGSKAPPDVFVLLDLAQAARRKAILKHRDAFARVRSGLDDAKLRIDKVRELVQPGYTAARLDVPSVRIPDVAKPSNDWRDGCVDDDARSDALEAAVSYLPPDQSDRLVSLRRACSSASAALESRAHTKAAEDARKQQRDLVDVVEPAVKRGLRDMCDSLADAVKAGAWIGPEAPSSDLWRVDEVAALTKDVVLVRFACTRDSVTPGTVWVTREATYFAPSLVGKVSSFFSFSSKKEEKLIRMAHADLSKASRVASPVPLKSNAVSLKSRDGTSLILTLITPGASVSAFVDVVTTCAAPRPPPRPSPTPVVVEAPKPAHEDEVAGAARRLREALAPVAEPPPTPPRPEPMLRPPPVPAPEGDDDDDVFLDALDGS